MARRIRIGVDVGGTFTDFVLIDEERDVIFTGKRLTTPGDPSDAIIAGTARLLAEAERPVGDLDSGASWKTESKRRDQAGSMRTANDSSDSATL